MKMKGRSRKAKNPRHVRGLFSPALFYRGSEPMSASGLGRVKTPTFNLPVEIPSRLRKFENQKCLRRLLREADRENNSAHSWLVHVFTQPGSKAALTAPKSNFCFTPESGLNADIAPCRF